MSTPPDDPQTAAGYAVPHWIEACQLDDLTVDQPHGLRLSGRSICVVLTPGEVFAVHDACTHGAIPLSEGEVDHCAIECWLHGSRFDLRTGEALNPPATEAVRTFPVQVIGGTVYIEID